MTASYHLDPYLRRLVTEVVDLRAAGREVVLADTILYPTGGGQPHDCGSLEGRDGTVSVVSVRAEDGDIVHELAEPWTQGQGPAEVHLDWSRRFDHMQQHTAQHVLSAVAEDRHGWKTTAFHLGETLCDVELAVAELTPSQLDQLEAEVVEVFRNALPVSDRWVAPSDLQELAVRSRGLPDGHQGLVRLVEIAGIDTNTCGGTHLRSTAEAESLKLLGTEAMRGGTRLYWVAGGRVRQRLETRERLLMGLRTVLEGADEELEALACKKKEQAQAAQRDLRAASDLLIDQWLVAALAADAELVAQSVDPLGGEAVSRLARSFAARCSESGRARCLLVASSQGPVALAAEGGLDAQSLGRKLGEQLGVRGGGKGPVFQGKLTDSLDASDFLARAAPFVQELLDS